MSLTVTASRESVPFAPNRIEYQASYLSAIFALSVRASHKPAARVFISYIEGKRRTGTNSMTHMI